MNGCKSRRGVLRATVRSRRRVMPPVRRLGGGERRAARRVGVSPATRGSNASAIRWNRVARSPTTVRVSAARAGGACPGTIRTLTGTRSSSGRKSDRGWMNTDCIDCMARSAVRRRGRRCLPKYRRVATGRGGWRRSGCSVAPTARANGTATGAE
jgi:hypothetical protein